MALELPVDRILLGVAPVGALAYFGDDGDGEGDDALHFVFDELGDFFDFGGWGVEEEFVVDLEGHFGLKVAGAEGGVDAEHGDLDHVGGGALERCVDSGAFGEAAGVGVAGVDVRDGPGAAEEGGDLAGFAGLREGLLDEGADACVAVEVGFDVGLGGLLIDAEVGGEAERGDAVDDAEVDGLGAVAGLLVHGFRSDAEDLAGGEGVDVEVVLVGVDEQRVLGEVRHEAELDLGVVGGEEDVVCWFRGTHLNRR